jgi:hypothetical protein
MHRKQIEPIWVVGNMLRHEGVQDHRTVIAHQIKNGIKLLSKTQMLHHRRMHDHTECFGVQGIRSQISLCRVAAVLVFIDGKAMIFYEGIGQLSITRSVIKPAPFWQQSMRCHVTDDGSLRGQPLHPARVLRVFIGSLIHGNPLVVEVLPLRLCHLVMCARKYKTALGATIIIDMPEVELLKMFLHERGAATTAHKT